MFCAASVAVAKKLVLLLGATATGALSAPDGDAVAMATGVLVVSQLRPA